MKRWRVTGGSSGTPTLAAVVEPRWGNDGRAGTAPDRVDLLSRAFSATLKDNALRAEAARMNLAINAISGDQVAALLKPCRRQWWKKPRSGAKADSK